jgi:regulator of nucleoside diphosphate kinase
MRSKLVLRELADGSLRTITLCYPVDADATQGRVSVMSPLGMALIGLPRGAIASWQCPDGDTRVAEVHEIVYQPEASGDFLA